MLNLNPSWSVPYLEYFDLIKSVSILFAFHRRNWPYVMCWRCHQRAGDGGHFLWNYSLVGNQCLEVLEFYVGGLNLAEIVASLFWFFDKSSAYVLSKYCNQRIDLKFHVPPNETHAEMSPQGSSSQSVMISN